MSRALDDLHPGFRPWGFEFLARLVEDGIAVCLVDTLRTEAEHLRNLERGSSWVKKSNHLYGLALDACPYEQFKQYGPDKLQWDKDDPVWQRYGEIAERIGLDWGGRWGNKDMAHVEHPRAFRLRDLVPWPRPRRDGSGQV